MSDKNKERPEDIFSYYLSKQGMKLTNQRKLIVSEFFNVEEHREHLSAEDLYQKLRSIDPSLGQATVYRTLKLMRDAGLARELNFGDDVTRFEPKVGTSHHDHLICESCGKTLAVLDENIEVLQTNLARAHGFKLTGHRMYLYGICHECQTADPGQINS